MANHNEFIYNVGGYGRNIVELKSYRYDGFGREEEEEKKDGSP